MREPYLQDPDVTLYHGDVLAVLRELPDESVDCAATSPPFYGLRDYGTGRWEGGDEGCAHEPGLNADRSDRIARNEVRDDEEGTYAHPSSWSGGGRKALTSGPICGKCGARRIDQQIGLEATPEEWRDRLVEVFREVRRVLVPTGTLWVECGDVYGHGPMGGTAGSSVDGPRGGKLTSEGRTPNTLSPGIKPKDLVGAPFLLAFGLRDDGWWWRSTNIWMKPNCLPESVTDRPVVQHSYVFQFSKKARYYCDMEAVREPAEWARWGDQTVVKEQPDSSKSSWIKPKSKAELRHTANVQALAEEGSWVSGGLDNGKNWPDGRATGGPAEGASKSLRSVWNIPTEGFPEAHFATWPTKLAERIIRMACPESVCRVCGVPRTRITSTEYENPGNRQTNGPRSIEARDDPLHGTINSRGSRLEKRVATEGFTDCGCSVSSNESNESKYRPGIVLDPFAGACTTLVVARRLRRHSVGIDLSSDYLALGAKRLATWWKSPPQSKRVEIEGQESLFA